MVPTGRHRTAISKACAGPRHTKTLDAMENAAEQVTRWSQGLCQDVAVAGLLSRNPTAHKWKAPFRSLILRETLLWRMHDLGQQILVLSQQQHLLGARILLRSAIETLATLIYLNQKMDAVIARELSFFAFDELTKQLLMGSRTGATSQAAINILTVLAKAEKKHSGLVSMHERLSESAHPNFDGVLYTYSASDPDKYETRFSNRWVELFGAEQEPAMAFIFAVFESEYNDAWPDLFEKLESWLRDNDAELERQRNGI